MHIEVWRNQEESTSGVEGMHCSSRVSVKPRRLIEEMYIRIINNGCWRNNLVSLVG